MARVLADKQGGPLVSFAQLPLAILAVTGLLIVVWIVGLRWFLRDPEGRPHCWMVVLGAFALVALAASGGKLYYAAPALFPALAAGGVALERRSWARGWFGSPALGALVVVSWVSVTLPMLPFLPATDASSTSNARHTAGPNSHGKPPMSRRRCRMKPSCSRATTARRARSRASGRNTGWGHRSAARITRTATGDLRSAVVPASSSRSASSTHSISAARGEGAAGSPRALCGRRRQRGDHRTRRDLHMPRSARNVGAALAAPPPPQLSGAPPPRG
jgi:hypothetical protein